MSDYQQSMSINHFNMQMSQGISHLKSNIFPLRPIEDQMNQERVRKKHKYFQLVTIYNSYYHTQRAHLGASNELPFSVNLTSSISTVSDPASYLFLE